MRSLLSNTKCRLQRELGVGCSKEREQSRFYMVNFKDILMNTYEVGGIFVE